MVVKSGAAQYPASIPSVGSGENLPSEKDFARPAKGPAQRQRGGRALILR